MGIWENIFGTLSSYFKIGGAAGVRLKNNGGNLIVRNTGDSADAAITADAVHVSGNSFDINSDAAGAGADWKVTIQRPTSGMTADVVLTLPVDDGTANQVLQTDGNGVLSWASAASTTACTTRDTTSLAFNSSSPVTMFTLPANAVLDKVTVIVDTAFDGTPSLTVGKSGSTSKYVGSTDVDLATAGGYVVHNTQAPAGSTEALIITYSQGGATVGAARVIVDYSIPA